MKKKKSLQVTLETAEGGKNDDAEKKMKKERQKR